MNLNILFKNMSNITLLSNDNEELIVNKEIAAKSVLIKNMLEDIEEDDKKPIPLPNITGNILKKVIEWCEYHKNDFKEYEDGYFRNTEINEWNQKYMDVDQETLFDIILAANYLDIKPLLDIGCKTVANMIKGKSTEDIRRIFNIENDFTQEEESQIKKENEWAEDN